MRSLLPRFWFAIAAFTLLAGVFAQSPWLSNGMVPVIFAALPSVATAAIANLTIAVIYLLMLRTTSDGKVVLFGWLHAWTYLGAKLAETWMTYDRNSTVVSGERIVPRDLILQASTQSVFFALATLSFLAAAICAYQNSRGTIDIKQFD